MSGTMNFKQPITNLLLSFCEKLILPSNIDTCTICSYLYNFVTMFCHLHHHGINVSINRSLKKGLIQAKVEVCQSYDQKVQHSNVTWNKFPAFCCLYDFMEIKFLSLNCVMLPGAVLRQNNSPSYVNFFGNIWSINHETWKVWISNWW